MAITKWDDYLIHQTAATIDAPGEGEEDFMDRIFLGCHSADGTLHLASGLGSYPNRNVMDAYVIVRHNDVQYSLSLSRHLNGDRADMQIGPLSYKVIEPLKRWGMYLAENDYGISCSLEFEARGVPYPLEPHGHYDHLGRFTGSITIEGKEFNADGFVGSRDRSWGVRHAIPWQSKDWFGHTWTQVHFSNFGLVMLFSGLWADTTRGYGAIINDDGSVIPITEMRHRLEFFPDVRAVKKAEMLLTDVNGKQRHLITKTLSSGNYMFAGGYDRNMEDRGPLSIEGEKMDVSRPFDIGSPLFGFQQQIAQFELDGEPGVGTFETSLNPDKERKYKATF